jgi:hypothetical protein
MTKLVNWEVSIEYGPTAADVHYVNVNATSYEDALIKGKQWADANGMRNALVCNATELPEGSAFLEDDDFTDIIEWTEEEEEEFIRLLDKNGDIK